MPRGTQRQVIIADLKAEIGHSTSASLGVSVATTLGRLVERTQNRLWLDYDWPFLREHKQIQTQAADRFYDFPTDFVLERIEAVDYKYNGEWCPVYWGIGPEQYNQHDPVDDDRESPVQRWDVYDDNQFEVWPLPANNGVVGTEEDMIRMRGIRNLSAFTDDEDTADLDDDLIVLFAKAEFLARQKMSDAQIALQTAETHYRKLKGRLGSRREVRMGGTDPRDAMPWQLQAKWNGN